MHGPGTGTRDWSRLLFTKLVKYRHGTGPGPGSAPDMGQHQRKPMGKGQDRARHRTSRRNNYYQTLIKSLILLLFQPIAKARTGPRYLADPLPSLGMGPVWVM